MTYTPKYNWKYSEILTSNMKKLFGDLVKEVHIDIIDDEDNNFIESTFLDWQKDNLSIGRFNSFGFNGQTIKLTFNDNQEMIIGNSEWAHIRKIE